MAKWILERARAKIGHLYPPGKDGKPVVGYIWARTAPCSNPSCRGEIPLLRSLLVCNKPGKQVALTMDIEKGKKSIRFGIASDRKIERRGLGIDLNPPLVDAIHRSMLLWKQEKRGDLVTYLGERGLLEDGPFWKLAQALFEVLPRDTEDWKLTSTLLGERETLRKEGKERDSGLFKNAD